MPRNLSGAATRCPIRAIRAQETGPSCRSKVTSSKKRSMLSRLSLSLAAQGVIRDDELVKADFNIATDDLGDLARGADDSRCCGVSRPPALELLVVVAHVDECLC